MAVASREQLKQYCLRNLGAPVVEINVDEDQLEDRIDEALDYWRLYHYDGIEKFYLKQQIRASEILLTTSTATDFTLLEKITGGTSGAVAYVTKESQRESSGNILLVKNVEGVFLPGETISGDVSLETATVTSITLGEYDKKYITVDDWIYGITKIIPTSGSSSSSYLFNNQYQMRVNDLYDLSSASMIYYTTAMQHLSLIDFVLNGQTIFRFNRLQGRLYLDINWDADVSLGGYVVVECYRAINPSEFTKAWGEPWLKHYVTALFKKQWGTNLKKFSGLQLPGGVTLDGNALYDEAVGEIKDLEDELENKSAPLNWFVG